MTTTGGGTDLADRAAGPGPTPQRSLRFLLSRGWITGIVTAIIGATLCFTVLAPWQFSRHAERAAANAAITDSVGAAPVPLDELLPRTAQVSGATTWREVTATGVFLADRQVAVGLRQDDASQPALEILVPLQLADGSVLLVDRGYVPVSAYPGTVPLPAPPSGTVTVTGRLQPWQPDPLQRPAIQRTGYLEVRGISPTSVPGLTEVRGGFVQLVDGSPGVLTPIGVPQIDAGPFLSYAWQWITFGTMALLALAFFIRREYVDPRPDDAQDGQDGPGDPTARRADDPTDGGPPAAPRPQRTRRRRGGFDRSELYDS